MILFFFGSVDGVLMDFGTYDTLSLLQYMRPVSIAPLYAICFILTQLGLSSYASSVILASKSILLLCVRGEYRVKETVPNKRARVYETLDLHFAQICRCRHSVELPDPDLDPHSEYRSGSGSPFWIQILIWIPILNTDPDLDPYSEYRSGFRCTNCALNFKKRVIFLFCHERSLKCLKQNNSKSKIISQLFAECGIWSSRERNN